MLLEYFEYLEPCQRQELRDVSKIMMHIKCISEKMFEEIIYNVGYTPLSYYDLIVGLSEYLNENFDIDVQDVWFDDETRQICLDSQVLDSRIKQLIDILNEQKD